MFKIMNEKARMISFLFIITLLMIPFPVLAQDTRSICITSDTVQQNTSWVIDGTITKDLSENIYCPTGCSATLNYCRLDMSQQIYLALGLIIVFIIMMLLSGWVSEKANYIDLAILALTATFSVMVGGLLDIFSTIFRTMFIVFAIVPVFFFVYSVINQRKMDKLNKEEKEGGIF